MGSYCVRACNAEIQSPHVEAELSTVEHLSEGALSKWAD